MFDTDIVWILSGHKWLLHSCILDFYMSPYYYFLL